VHSTRPSNFVGLLSGEGFDSNFAAVLGKRCDDGLSANALDLHLNLEGHDQVEITFWIQDYFDETHVDDGIYLSNDGGVTFAKAFDFRPGEWCEQYGQFPPFDLDYLAEIAGKPFSAQYVVRFQQYGSFDLSNSSGNGDGLAIDDVCVYVPVLEYKTPPFCDDFETGVLPSHWAWRWADETTVLTDFPTKPSNYVGVFSGDAANNSVFAVGLGKRCDDGPVSNALDLHLNLAGQTQVELTFWAKNYSDETHADDGIYLSNDGGVNFEKALDFLTSTWQESYFEFPVDLDMLANDAGIPFTNQYVVRFQQYGSFDFNNSSGNGDGFAIDDVCVTGVISSIDEGSSSLENIVRLYPNPAYSTLNIVINDVNAYHFSNLKIFDVGGRLLMTQQLDGAGNLYEVDIALLGDGVYYLRLDGEGNVAHKRFVKVSN
jgi:Secretion system C-terminal sorting domain